MNDIEILLKKFSQSNLFGLALDIDNTIAASAPYWIRKIETVFHIADPLLEADIGTKYRHVADTPYFQNPEIAAWLLIPEHEADVAAITPIMGAADYVRKIHAVRPILLYLTGRPDVVKDASSRWLFQNGFPDAPVMCRPVESYGSSCEPWKIEVLKSLYPHIQGIIDDNLGLVQQGLFDNYEGTIYSFGQHNLSYGKNAIACPGWENVYNAMQQHALSQSL